MLNEIVRTRLDIIDEMNLVDADLVTSVKDATSLLNKCSNGILKRDDSIIKPKIQVLYNESKYLLEVLRQIMEMFEEPVINHGPVSDPLDIN